jgi:hypothetical protein
MKVFQISEVAAKPASISRWLSKKSIVVKQKVSFLNQLLLSNNGIRGCKLFRINGMYEYKSINI